MSVLVACDLDQTLIYSARSAGADVGDAVCVEHHQGRPQSFVTPAAAAHVAALTGRGALVAVTSRTPAQLARVDLPGPAPRYAVAANGGRLLVDGVVDAQWSRGVERALTGVAGLAEVEAHVAQVCPDAWTSARRVAEGLFCYAVVDPGALPPDVAPASAAWAAERGWVFSQQGRKLYWIPAVVSKSAAALEVAARVGAELLVAAGDSLLDRDLLDAADVGWLPRHGELAAAGYRADHVRVTRGTGLAAGEEIAAALAAQVAARAA